MRGRGPGRGNRMANEHQEEERRRERLELLEQSRARGYITIWEVVAASAHSPVDLDEVGQVLTEAGITLDDSDEEDSNWVRQPESEEEGEEAEEEIEADVDQLP